MKKPESFKGRVVRGTARAAAAGPWRGASEKLACWFGHKFPNNRAVRSFCRHFAGILIEREGEGFERVAVFESGGKMRCGGGRKLGGLSSMYYFLGTITDQDEDERPLVALLERVVRKGDVFFDVGANFGFYSFYVGPLCGPSGEVHAFEANPLLIPHLRGSSEFNRPAANIIVNDVAVGREGNKTLQLYDPERIGCSSLYPLEWLDEKSSVTVPITTIDEYVEKKGIGRVDVMKVDIEGAELDAFLGMERTFEVAPPSLIVCELIVLFAGANGNGTQRKVPRGGCGDPAEVIKFLATKGYEARTIRNSDGRIAGRIDPGSLGELEQNLINVAFVRPELRTTRPEIFAQN